MIQEKRMVDQFVSLVSIDAPSYRERAIAGIICAELRNLGLQVSEDNAGAAIGGDCNNVYATWPGSRTDLEPLLFCAHFDTVEPGMDKKAVVQADGRITSAGDTVLGADDLSGITAILEAIRSIREAGLPYRTVELLLTVAEEQHLMGSRHFEPERLHARQAYILDAEGAPGTAVVRAPGNISFVFEIGGQAAHAGMAPEQGISAITAAARGVAAMNLGRIDTETTANIGRIFGGGETNVVADACTVTAECRSQNLAKLTAQADHMCNCMEQAVAALGARLSTRRQTVYHPYAVAPDSQALARFRKACDQLALPAAERPGGGGSDNNTLVLHGLDGLVLTCGMKKVHSRQEEILIKDLVDTARLVECLILLP
jgi:tripeptide aminopeptidase